MQECVCVVPRDPCWPSIFAAESKLILSALGDNAIVAHHIGSTAIPAILAKPVIDMLIEVADPELVEQCNAQMQKLGYQVKGEYGIPGRRYFRHDNDAGQRVYHLHVYAQGSSQVERHLAFRDYLNSHVQWAMQYCELKLELLTRYAQFPQRYQSCKTEFILKVDQLAPAWLLTDSSNQMQLPMHNALPVESIDPSFTDKQQSSMRTKS